MTGPRYDVLTPRSKSASSAAQPQLYLANKTPHCIPYTHIHALGWQKNLSEFELDPAKAWQRGRVLDAMLRAANPPVPRGVTRGSHETFNRLDAERQSQAARKLNLS